MATTLNYNQAIISAIKEKAENGNRSYVKKDDIIKHGALETTWDWYNNHLKKMEDVARKFVERQYQLLELGEFQSLDEARADRDEQLDKFNSELIDLKKEMLARVDPDHKHHCSKYDGAMIAAYAHGTEAVQNNTNREKKFQSRVAHTFATRAAFRHALEADFGIIILGTEFMSAEKATYLRKERELMRGVSGAEKNKTEVEEQISAMENAKAMAPGGAAYFDSVIESLNKKLKGFEDEITSAKAKLGRFYADHPEKVMAEPTIDEVMTKKEQEEKEEKRVQLQEQVNGMKKQEKTDLLEKHGVKFNKNEKSADLDERVIEVLAKMEEQADPEQKEVATA